MSDLERYAVPGYTPASNAREELRAVGEEQTSRPPPQIAPDTSSLRPADDVSRGPLPIETVADVLVTQGAVCNV
jgi:hypothetical protein